LLFGVVGPRPHPPTPHTQTPNPQSPRYSQNTLISNKNILKNLKIKFKDNSKN